MERTRFWLRGACEVEMAGYAFSTLIGRGLGAGWQCGCKTSEGPPAGGTRRAGAQTTRVDRSHRVLQLRFLGAVSNTGKIARHLRRGYPVDYVYCAAYRGPYCRDRFSYLSFRYLWEQPRNTGFRVLPFPSSPAHPILSRIGRGSQSCTRRRSNSNHCSKATSPRERKPKVIKR